MKKIIALLLVVAMTAAASVAGTIAYLQDTDSDVNVMTVGNVYIEQIEQERDANGDLVPFAQGKPAFPVVGEIKWDDTKVDVNGTKYLVFDDGLKNVIDKIVTVKNTGRSDAYVRTIVAIEAPNYDPDDLIHVNVNDDGVSNTNWAPVDLDGIKYVYSVFTYDAALKGKETSVPSMMQVFLDSEADNTYCEAFGDTWEILVLSQAVQTAGFDKADDAFVAAFGEADANNVANWFGGMANIVSVSDDAELEDAIANGSTTIVLEGGTFHMPAAAKGKTLTFIGTNDSVVEVVPGGQGEANGQLDYNLDGSTVTFNNVTIKTNNQTYAGYARLTATYNNCVMENCYCLNGDSEFNSCTFNVSGNQYNLWTWGAPNATFNNCTFNSDGKAVLLYGTANTNLTVNNCTFNDKGGLTSKKAAIEIGNDYNKSYTLTVNDTTVNGYEINDEGINTGSTLWANKNSMGKDKLNVVVDGVDVY